MQKEENLAKKKTKQKTKIVLIDYGTLATSAIHAIRWLRYIKASKKKLK